MLLSNPIHFQSYELASSLLLLFSFAFVHLS
jgi:hypothetical protein